MWREPLGRALTRQTDGVNPTILDDPLDAQGGTSCRNCSWTSSPRWTATGPRRAGPDGGDSKDPSISPGSASNRNATNDLDGSEHVPPDVRIRHRIQRVGLGRAHDR